MKIVGVPRTSPESLPVRTSRSMRRATSAERRSLFEAVEVEIEVRRVAAQVAVCERLLAVEQPVAHLPETALPRSRLRRRCGGQRVGMDLGQREVSEGETDPPLDLLLDPLDRSVRLSRVRAFVISVLEEERPS